MALLENDATKIAVRIEEAEEAILHELAAHMFRPHDPEWRARQDAMNNLRILRERTDLQLGTQTSSKDPHRSTRRGRPRHSWGSWGSVH